MAFWRVMAQRAADPTQPGPPPIDESFPGNEVAARARYQGINKSPGYKNVSIHLCLHDEPPAKWRDCKTSQYEDR